MTNSDPEYTDADSVDTAADQPEVPEQVNAGLPGPDDEIQVTGHVLGPGDGVDYKGPAEAQQTDDDQS